MDDCCFTDCVKQNSFTHMSTNDRFGQHWFCQNHWALMSYLFKMVCECIRNDFGCERNHKAEIDNDEKYLNTIKFDSKYWDLCDKHLGIYDEMIGVGLAFVDYD